MKRLMTLCIALATAAAIAACGGTSSGTASGTPAASAGSETVAVEQLSGVGRVLVDHGGKAIYTPNLEAGGKIVCENACTAFWKPLMPGNGAPTAPAAVSKLGVITRPDGSRQVTVNGKPLYTFSEDAPGKSTGNGFSDEFGGHHFTWHVVRPGGTTSGVAGSGNGQTTTGSTGGYGY